MPRYAYVTHDVIKQRWVVVNENDLHVHYAPSKEEAEWMRAEYDAIRSINIPGPLLLTERPELSA